MSRNSRTDEALDRVRQAAAQLQPAAAEVKPLAGSTGAAAKRGVHTTRAWAAPRVEHTGQVLEDNVAPKASALLSSVTQLLEPDKPPRPRRWRTPIAIAAAADAAAFDALVHFLKLGLRTVLAAGLVMAAAAFFTGPSHAAVATRSGITSGLDWIRHFGERKGVSTGPVGQWTYQHRKGLRIGAVALFAVIFVFWGEPTAGLVIVLVILLLVVLGLIELIGRPAAEPKTAGPA